MLVLKKHRPKSLFCVKIGLLQSFENKYSSKRLGGLSRNPEIAVIPNKYRDTHDDPIDIIDPKSMDRPESSDQPELLDQPESSD